jgi:hypothetical protein
VDRTFSTGAGSHALLQCRSGIGHFVVHDQALGGQTPELVATVECLNEFGGLRLGERFDGTFRPSFQTTR